MAPHPPLAWGVNERNWRRSRTMRALTLATCLRDGHVWTDDGRVCVRCVAARNGYDPATLENVVHVLNQAIGSWPPEDEDG